MKKTYRVIWFDDEHKSRSRIREQAHLNGIILDGHTNAADGIKELRSNIKTYDAALLDGLFYNNPHESGTPTKDNALGDVFKELLRLESIKILPRFILSGQDSFTKEKNRFAESFKDGEVFDKLGDDEHLNSLWSKIKNKADKQPETQARHNNPEIFEIFNLGYLPESLEENILDLLLKPLPTSNSELKDILTNIRSIHESCLIKLESIKVIPNSNDSFAKIMKHLSGYKIWDGNKKTLVPTAIEYQKQEIENLNKWIYFTCGTYIHNLKNQHYDGYMISNYAVESIRKGLLEILLWFKKTYSENINN